MNITDIRTIVVGNPWKNWVFVVVETSSGITGLGEATGGLQTMPNKEAVEEIKHLAIGKNPLEISNVVDEMRENNNVGYFKIYQMTVIVSKFLKINAWSKMS